MTWLKKDIRIGDIINLVGLAVAGLYMIFKLQGTVESLEKTLTTVNTTVISINKELFAVRDRVLVIETLLKVNNKENK